MGNRLRTFFGTRKLACTKFSFADRNKRVNTSSKGHQCLKRTYSVVPTLASNPVSLMILIDNRTGNEGRGVEAVSHQYKCTKELKRSQSSGSENLGRDPARESLKNQK